MTEWIDVSAPSSNIELVINGDMEDGNPPTGWAAINNPEVFERSSTHHRSHAYALHIVDSVPSYGGANQLISGLAGKTIKCSLWCYSVYGNVYALRIYDGEGSLALVDVAITGSWVYVEQTVTVRSGVLELSFVANMDSSPGGSEFYIDDVSVREVMGYTWILCEAPIVEIMAYDIFTSEDSPSMKEFMGNINATEKFTIKDMRS